MKPQDCTVLVLDDDGSILKSLERLLTLQGFKVRTYSTAADFFAGGPPPGLSCLLLDQELGASTGNDVCREMKRRGWKIPIVFLTADTDIHSVVQAMRTGADDYLTKPYDPDELLAATMRALEHSSVEAQGDIQLHELCSRAARLTAREKVIVSMVVAGMLNKQIADHLKLALVTVKVHRGRAMRKLGARNAAELARLAAIAGIVSGI